MASNHLVTLGFAVLLLGSLGGPPAHADAPPAKIAPEAGTTLPAELLTIPEPPRAETGIGVPVEAPLLPGPNEATPAPAPATRISLDSRDRLPLPAVADGDRDRSLFVRLRWPF